MSGGSSDDSVVGLSAGVSGLVSGVTASGDLRLNQNRRESGMLFLLQAGVRKPGTCQGY
jgi:hypothetical protein